MNSTKGFSARIRNFGSFVDSGFFNIDQGINTFIGINNAGKTALLFALAGLSVSARTKHFGHPWGNVGELIKRYKRSEADPVIEVAFPIAPARTEILKTLCGFASQPNFPAKGDDRDTLRFVWILGDEPGLANICSTVYFNGKVIEKDLLRITSDPPEPSKLKVIVSEHPYGVKTPSSSSRPNFEVIQIPSRSDVRSFKFKESNQLSQLWPTMFESVVFLSTHRNPPARVQHNHEVALDPIASNLAQVLATIQMSSPEIIDGREIFGEIQKELISLFPEIRRVRTEIVPSDRNGQALNLEIKLDLASGMIVPLSHSGTGIQQILALLTGAFVSKKGSLFLLDEPHSYLHPSAERGLIRVLEHLGRERGHYFCIATHSPIFASHSRNRLYAIRATIDGGSKIRNIAAAADIMDALGVSNPDLFTYSRVVFVEGQSDEKVIRSIINMSPDITARHRLKIQPIGGNGILKNRSRAEFIRLLHEANASEIHIPIRFVLDSHDWGKEERQKLASLTDPEGKPVVHFLKLPEIENYLLCPSAIVHAIKKCLATRNMSTAEPTVAAIEQIIKSKFMAKGSEVLNTVFENYKCDYSKNKDIDSLLSYILANCPEHLNQLSCELADPLQIATKNSQPEK